MLRGVQVNSGGAEALVELLRSQCALTPDTVLLDVCCGTGTLGLCMAARVKRVLGIEACAAAVDDAERNARHNGITNASFVAAKAEKGLEQIIASLDAAERTHLTAIVDPPRAGLHPSVLRTLRACTQLTRILFVSCHPPAFVSNAAVLCQPDGGAREGRAAAGAPFVLTRAFPIDLFPDTRLCELVALLERGTDGEPPPPPEPAAKRARLDEGDAAR